MACAREFTVNKMQVSSAPALARLHLIKMLLHSVTMRFGCRECTRRTDMYQRYPRGEASKTRNNSLLSLICGRSSINALILGYNLVILGAWY